GTPVHDSATLSSYATGAAGQATYTVYSDSGCSIAVGSGGTKTVANGVVPDSGDVTLNRAGKYYWQVVYSGDTPTSTPVGTGFTRGSTSACGSEIEVVEVQSSIVTLLSSGNGATVISGSSVHDSATLSSFATGAGGQVTYTVYSDPTCTTPVASGGTKTVANGGAPNSDDVTLTTTGSYYWQVVYSGDTPSSTPVGTGFTRRSSSACTSEVEVVINPATSISIFDRITGLPTSGTQSTGTVNYSVY